MLRISSYFLYTLALLSVAGGLYITSHSYSPMLAFALTIITALLFAIGGLVLSSLSQMKLHIETQTRYLKHASKRRKHG